MDQPQVKPPSVLVHAALGLQLLSEGWAHSSMSWGMVRKKTTLYSARINLVQARLPVFFREGLKRRISAVHRMCGQSQSHRWTSPCTREGTGRRRLRSRRWRNTFRSHLEGQKYAARATFERGVGEAGPSARRVYVQLTCIQDRL